MSGFYYWLWTIIPKAIFVKHYLAYRYYILFASFCLFALIIVCNRHLAGRDDDETVWISYEFWLPCKVTEFLPLIKSTSWQDANANERLCQLVIWHRVFNDPVFFFFLFFFSLFYCNFWDDLWFRAPANLPILVARAVVTAKETLV